MFDEVKEKFKDLEKKLSEPEIISDQKEMIKLSQEHSNLKRLIDLIASFELANKHLEENKAMIANEKDSELKEMAEGEINELQTKISNLKEEIDEELNPASPNDKKNAIIETRAGADTSINDYDGFINTLSGRTSAQAANTL